MKIQEQFLNEARKNKKLVSITMNSGKSFTAKIKAFGAFEVLVVKSEGGQDLLYKHAIESIHCDDELVRDERNRG